MIEQDIRRYILSLTLEERCEMLQMLQESIIRNVRKGRGDEDHFLSLLSTMEGVVGEDILDGSRKDSKVLARSFLAYQLHRDGYTECQIGRLLNLNHSTINYLKRKAKDVIDYPAINRDAFQIWQQFQKHII